MGNQHRNEGRGVKSPRLIVRLSESEAATLRERAKAAGVSVAEYVRRRLFQAAALLAVAALSAGCISMIQPDCTSPAEQAYLAMVQEGDSTCLSDPATGRQCYGIWKHHKDSCSSDFVVLCSETSDIKGTVYWHGDGTFTGTAEISSPCSMRYAVAVAPTGIKVMTLDSIGKVKI